MRKCNMRWFSPQRMKKHLAFALAVSLVAMVPVSAFAQVLKISMTKTNVSIENVLRELEKQSDYTFFYNDNQVKLNKKVSINVSDAPIETVLDEVFKNSGYTYKIVDNQIVGVYSSCSSERGTGYPATETKKYFGGCERCNGRSHHRSIGYRKRKSD